MHFTIYHVLGILNKPNTVSIIHLNVFPNGTFFEGYDLKPNQQDQRAQIPLVFLVRKKCIPVHSISLRFDLGALQIFDRYIVSSIQWDHKSSGETIYGLG